MLNARLVLMVLALSLAANLVSAQQPSRLTVASSDLVVVDGDTIDRPETNTRYRVYGLDVPEIYSAGCMAERRAGEVARDVATRIIREARSIRIEPTGNVQPATDRYRERVEAGFVVDDQDFNQLMIDAGVGRRDARGDGYWCDVLPR